MFVTNWISTTKIQKISEITNFFRHYFLSRTEVFFYVFSFEEPLFPVKDHPLMSVSKSETAPMRLGRKIDENVEKSL